MSDRIAALDFVKGILVVFMVVYHGLNYLGYESLPHNVLPFVPPSFILIAGFIVTHVYAPRSGPASRRLASRLAARSLKLVMLFTLLNVGAALVFSSRHGGAALNLQNMVAGWSEIYIQGGSRWAAFEVLLPIGYLLLLSIPVLLLQSRLSSAVFGVSTATVASCLALEYYGSPAYNLYLIGAGFVGMAIGLLRDRALEAVTGSWGLPGFLCALSWVFFLRFGDSYMNQLAATVGTLLLLYAAGRRMDPRRWLPEQVLALGRYSLLAYIVQIFYLQLFKRLPLYGDVDAAGTALLIVSTAILTWATVRIVDCTRGRIGLVDRSYRAIFA